MSKSKYAEVEDLIDEAEEALGAALDTLKNLQRAARAAGLSQMARRMDAYTLGWMDAFIGDANQPGSIEDLRNDVMEAEVEDDDNEGAAPPHDNPPRFRPGDRVGVVSGLYEGMTGYAERTDRKSGDVYVRGDVTGETKVVDAKEVRRIRPASHGGFETTSR